MAFYEHNEDEEVLLTDSINIPSDTPIGVVLPFAGTRLPYGFLWCNGKEYSAVEYPELFELIGNKFGGSAGYTFCVPFFDNGRYFKQCEDENNLLKKHPAYAPAVYGESSPNHAWDPNHGSHPITGNGELMASMDYDKIGPSALTGWSLGKNGDGMKSSGSDNYKWIGFDASRSNPIYGRDPDRSVLRGKTIAVPYIIKAKSIASNEPLYQKLIKGNSMLWKYYEESL